MNKRDYVKHLVECNCILPIFREMPNPPFHKFIVFSVIETPPGMELVPHYATCPNCAAVHKIEEVGKSTILRKEVMTSIREIEEIEMSLPPNLSPILKKNDCQRHVWEEVEFILENELWGKRVVLAKEKQEDGSTNVKVLFIAGHSLFKVENHEL